MWKYWSGVIVSATLILAVMTMMLQSVRGAQGPKERTFMIRISLWVILLILAFIASILLLEPPCRYVAPAIFVFLIPVLVYRWTVQAQLIRHIEERERNPPPPEK